jgi:RNA polymerase sigma-70 factor (ECF subfamily)
LQQVLDGLDEKKRAVLVLVELEGLSSPEIAKILGIGLNTVYSRLRAAREDFERLAARCHARNARRSL